MGETEKTVPATWRKSRPELETAILYDSMRVFQTFDISEHCNTIFKTCCIATALEIFWPFDTITKKNRELAQYIIKELLNNSVHCHTVIKVFICP